MEACVRLLRPLDSKTVSEAEPASSRWEETSLMRFRESWESEVAALPEFRERTFHLVTGLLLPIWDRLDKRGVRVYRLRTDDGRRLLGRVIRDHDLPAFFAAMGLDAPEMSPDDLWRSVRDGGVSHALARGVRIRRSKVMGENRVELAHDGGPAIFDAMARLGCMTEIIQYRRRAFIPTSAEGPAILARVLERFPLIGAEV